MEEVSTYRVISFMILAEGLKFTIIMAHNPVETK